MKDRRSTPGASPEPSALEGEEEKVIRMRQGLRAPDDLPLEMVGRDKPDLWAKLREIENRAFEKSGRFEQIQKRAIEEEAAEAADSTKDKIVARLKEKVGQAAEVAAEAAAVTPKKKSR